MKLLQQGGTFFFYYTVCIRIYIFPKLQIQLEVANWYNKYIHHLEFLCKIHWSLWLHFTPETFANKLRLIRNPLKFVNLILARPYRSSNKIFIPFIWTRLYGCAVMDVRAWQEISKSRLQIVAEFVALTFEQLHPWERYERISSFSTPSYNLSRGMKNSEFKSSKRGVCSVCFLIGQIIITRDFLIDFTD